MSPTMTGRVAATPSSRLCRGDGALVEWRHDERLVDYLDATTTMEARVAAIRAGEACELVWLLEHPPLYTAGTGARDAVPTHGLPFPLYESGRGGQLTFHGPGQRIAYALIDLQARGADVRGYVAALERWLVAALARLGVAGERRDERVGIWVRRPDGPEGRGGLAEDKIAALGVRVRRGVAFHGVSLNVAPDLAPFAAITPCGIAAPHLGVTSLAALGLSVGMADVDAALRAAFADVFG